MAAAAAASARRRRRPRAHPNPLFARWLREWRDEAQGTWVCFPPGPALPVPVPAPAPFRPCRRHLAALWPRPLRPPRPTAEAAPAGWAWPKGVWAEVGGAMKGGAGAWRKRRGLKGCGGFGGRCLQKGVGPG
uniref:Uncharacterized protein n=1 Tax=Cyanoderma ruficeps TaxID=181631 RepID=A0A8C3P3Z2_9PASS